MVFRVFVFADGGLQHGCDQRLHQRGLLGLPCAWLERHAERRLECSGGDHLRAGQTEAAACERQLRDDAEVVVAELVPEVIAWNADPRYGISVDAMGDPRVRVVHDDVINVLRANPGAFDAIMLDTDNGPDGMLMSELSLIHI